MPGYLIKQRRERLGFSQAEVAAQLFISQSAYSRIENKQTTLTVDMARRIAVVLKCGLDDLLPPEAILENSNQLAPPELEAMVDRTVKKHMDELKLWLQEQFAERSSTML
jgi:transcriptional regulator with XRE-family HTH domain